MKNTILIDFDGVIRHWTGNEIEISELRVGVPAGIVLSVAFSAKYLVPAIEGKITHEEWVAVVEKDLTKRYNHADARKLVSGWIKASWEVDKKLIEGIRSVAPKCKLVLVTNATSKLSADLAISGLESEFDFIVNSSDIGVTKPNFGFYENSLKIVGTTVRQSVFIDDTLSNVEASLSFGIDSIQHQTTDKTLEFVNQLCT